jgi:hypothetical protein
MCVCVCVCVCAALRISFKLSTHANKSRRTLASEAGEARLSCTCVCVYVCMCVCVCCAALDTQAVTFTSHSLQTKPLAHPQSIQINQIKLINQSIQNIRRKSETDQHLLSTRLQAHTHTITHTDRMQPHLFSSITARARRRKHTHTPYATPSVLIHHC